MYVLFNTYVEIDFVGLTVKEKGFRLYVCYWLIDDRLYSAIRRSLEQTHCARMWFYMSD